MLLGLSAMPVAAHFLLNLNVRIFHVEHRADGLDILVRMPMPYLLADKLGPAQPDGLPTPAPYSTNALDGDRLVHYVDFAQLQADPLGLGSILAEGLSLDIENAAGQLEVQAVRVHPLGIEPGFATLEEALAVFARDQPSIPADRKVYVGDAVVDVYLRLLTGAPVERYQLSSTLNPGLPGQEDTANLVLDYGPGGVEVFRARGLLQDPIEMSRSALAAFGTFVVEGMRHILEGLDHLLFVLCLVAGATSIAALLWRVTGFTLGHSVTLSLGFFGFVPSGDWFIPLVELIIALTILYAAWIAIRTRQGVERSHAGMFLVTSFIGLIHGLGFSFVLHKILKVSSPNIWQSLLAFNVGIEVGQLVIVASASLLIWLFARVGANSERAVRLTMVVAAGCTAMYWVAERSLPFVAAVL